MNAEIAFAREDVYGDSLVDTPTWWQPGVNISLTGPSLDRQQSRVRQPGDPRPKRSRPGQLQGTMTVEFDLAGDAHHWEDAVFHSGGADPTADSSLPPDEGRAPSYHIYVAGDLLDGTTSERSLVGATVIDAELTWSQDENVRISLTIEYADEDETATTPTATDIEVPSAEDVYAYHGASISVGTVTQANLSTATLSLSSLARLRYGQGQTATDAVVDGAEPSFSTDATYTETDQLTRALTGRGDGALIGTADAGLTFANAAGHSRTFTLANCQPTSYEWADLIAPQTDHSENVEYHLTDVTVS